MAHHHQAPGRDEGRRQRRRNEDGAFQEVEARVSLQPSEGARLTYADLLQREPQDAPVENHIPLIHRAVSNPTGLQTLDCEGIPYVPNTPPDFIPPIHLMNADVGNAIAGYSFVRKLTNLKHAPGWGEVWSGISFSRVREKTFRAPQPGRFVCIKKLNKRVVDHYLRVGNSQANLPRDYRHMDEEYIRAALRVRDRENPLRECSRMDEIGDNIHVLRQIEFLQDDKYLYIIMPHASGRRSLDQALFRRDKELSPREAHLLFVQILRILSYLELHRIHHRDLSPDNFIFLDDDQLVVMDLAMSVRIPVDSATGSRTLINALGRFGTPAFMSPEVWNNFQAFDGVSADLWSAMLILYAMLTNVPLYRRPDAQEDISYRYYVVAGGITQDPMNELIQEILGDLREDPTSQHILVNQAQAHLGLPPNANELFHHFFRLNPATRWTLAEVMQSNYVVHPEEND